MKGESKRTTWDMLASQARRARRLWGRGMLVLVVGAALSFASTQVFRPSYRSETVLLYRESIHTDDERELSTRIIGAKLKEMLLARTKLDVIMDQFKLYASIRATDPFKAVEAFRSNIKFIVNENTFTLAFEADDPALAQKVTARLAEGLIEESSALRRERAEATKLFLEAQKKRNDEELKVFEQRYAKFLQLHPEFVAVALNPNAPTPSGGKKGSTRAELHTGARDAVEQKKGALRARLSGGGSVPGKTEELKSAEQQVAEAEAELKDAQRKFTENHPDVSAARTKLQVARGARDRAKSIQPMPLSDSEKGTLQNELNRLERLSAATGSGKRDDTALLQEGDAIIKNETEWSTINRDVQEARERIKLLDDRLFKATIALNVETSSNAAQLLIVDPAYQPVAPNKNSKKQVILAGLGIALVLAMLIVFLYARTDDRLYVESEVEHLKLGAVTVTVSNRSPALRAAQRRG